VGPAPGYVPRAPEDNLVEGNEVRMTFNAPGRESVGVLFGWAARGNLVRENVIHTADTGLTSMIQFSPETFPGECARSPLHCVADEDCGDRGPCEGVRTFPAGVVDSRNQSTIVDNTFLGPFRAHNASGSSKGDRWIDNTFKNVGGLGIEVFGDIPGAGIDGQTFVGATDTLVSGNMIDGARLAISDWGLRSVIVENEVMNSINTGILLRPPGSSAVVARNTVDKVALGSAVNIQAPGSTVGDNVVRRAAAFGIFVFGGGFSGTVVHDNRIENNGVAIGLNLNAPVPFAMKISRNDIVQANASFRVVTLFPPASPPAQPEVFELSDELRGNYWGRTCDDDKGFREAALPPPQDSNHIRLVDSHPYGQPVAGQPLDAFAPCL